MMVCSTKVLAVDIETYSDVDLKEVGVYRYVDTPSFEVLLFAYAYGNEPVQVVDLTKEQLPEQLAADLTNESVIKTAFNAAFERVCLDKFLGVKTGPWDCTMIRAWELGLSGGLAAIGRQLNITTENSKYDGKRLIKLFSVPRRPTKSNPSTRVLPRDKPEEWQDFIEYCGQDVVAERAIRSKLLAYEIHPKESLIYHLDQKINDRGIRVDYDYINKALSIKDELESRALDRYQEITGLPSPKSLIDIKKWIYKQTGMLVSSINKSNAEELMKKFEDYPKVQEVLSIRYASSKSSIAKYQKMLDTACSDGRSRGNTQFFGAHTGRWAGRLIQLQNLPKNHLADIDTARDMVNKADLDLLAMVYDDPSDVLRQCIRTAIIPDKGHKFVVADFSAIEARVIAWLAREQWRLDVFNTHGKIYEASASQMFGVPIEQITKGSSLRQKGKVAELALGYAGSTGALINMGALSMGLSEDELPEIVQAWRAANPAIKQLWYAIENNCVKALKTFRSHRINEYLSVERDGSTMFITLPSGRRIAYPKARLQPHSKFEGKEQIVFNDDTETYYGKLTENIVQAVARDCLAEAMLKLDAKGYDIVFHVHDEVIIEVPENDNKALDVVCEIMGEPIDWAPGLPLSADGYECNFYKKD